MIGNQKIKTDPTRKAFHIRDFPGGPVVKIALSQQGGQVPSCKFQPGCLQFAWQLVGFQDIEVRHTRPCKSQTQNWQVFSTELWGDKTSQSQLRLKE